MITSKGEIDDSRLVRTLGFEEHPGEFVIWIEWRLDGELVKRDAHVILKHGVAALAEAGGF